MAAVADFHSDVLEARSAVRGLAMLVGETDRNPPALSGWDLCCLLKLIEAKLTQALGEDDPPSR